MLNKMEPVEPYISLVVTARNDDHGGDLLNRMQAFTEGWIEQSNRFALESELIIVEWNPAEERAPLADALRWPAENRYCRVRVITVPQSVHRKYRHADALGLYQMIAKNVGIRRARGKFVLATNIDILFSSELVAKLALRDLSAAKMYRIDRHDAMGDVPPDVGIEERLLWCSEHLLRVNSREGTFPLSARGLRAACETDIADKEAGISFEANWFSPEVYAGEPFRWLSTKATLHACSPANGDQARELNIELEPAAGTGFGPFFLVALDGHGNRVAEHWVHRRQVVQIPLNGGLGKASILTLHVVGGGRHIEADPRVLNARVMRVGWDSRMGMWNECKWWLRRAYRRLKGWEKTPRPTGERQASEMRAGLRYGAGWGEWEWIGEDYSRWLRGEGELVLSSEGGWGELEMDLEVGPDALGERVRVGVSEDGGEELHSEDLTGRHRFVWKSGGDKRTVRNLRLRVEGGNAANGSGRVLLMRRLCWKPRTRPAGPLPQVEMQKQGVGAVHLHTNGCGDFTLLSREAWFDLRGYPEFDAFSMNIDSVLCWSAHHAGYWEEVFEEPLRIYHLEHGVGSGWTPQGESDLYERIARMNVPWLTYPDVIAWARDMNRFSSPFVFNRGNWGLAGEEFEERVIP